MDDDEAPLPGLRRNFSWTLGGTLTYALCQWWVLVIVAKLEPEGCAGLLTGRFGLGLAVATPIFLFTDLNLRAVQATDARAEHAFGHYLALRLVSLPLALGAAIVTALCGYHGESALVIVGIALVKCADSLSEVCYGTLQQRERMAPIARSMALRGLLALGALAAVTALSGSLFAGILAMAGARALVLLAYDGRAVMRTGEGCLRPLWERERLWRLASLALPLGVVMGLGSLQMNIPRYVIEANYGERQLGLFFAMFHLIAAGTLVVGALGQTASPRLARYFAEGDLRAFWRLLALLLLLALALSCAGFLLALVAGRPILAALYAPEYAARFDVFLWIVAGSSTCFCAAFLGCAVTAMRAFDRLLLPYGAATAATAVVAFLLIPGYGLIGAAWTFGLGGLATCAAPTYILLTSRPLRGAEAPPAGER